MKFQMTKRENKIKKLANEIIKNCNSLENAKDIATDILIEIEK